MLEIWENGLAPGFFCASRKSAQYFVSESHRSVSQMTDGEPIAGSSLTRLPDQNLDMSRPKAQFKSLWESVISDFTFSTKESE